MSLRRLLNSQLNRCARGFFKVNLAIMTASVIATPGLMLLHSKHTNPQTQTQAAPSQSPLQAAVEQHSSRSLDGFDPFAELTKQLNSSDRLERLHAAELLSKTHKGSIGRLAKALLHELRETGTDTDVLVEQLKSNDSAVAAKAKKELLLKGDAGISAIASALRTDSNGLSSQLDLAVTSDRVGQVAQIDAEQSSKPDVKMAAKASLRAKQTQTIQMMSPLDTDRLIESLQSCNETKDCEAAKALINHPDAIEARLLQTSLQSNQKVRMLARYILSHRRQEKSDSFFFHSYDKSLSKLQTKESAAMAKESVEKIRPTSIKAIPSLLGSRWVGTDSDNESLEFDFRSDGQLSYSNSSGTFHNGNWSQTGARVVLDINNGFAHFTGEMRNGSLEGTGSNSSGEKWGWTATRR